MEQYLSPQALTFRPYLFGLRRRGARTMKKLHSVQKRTAPQRGVALGEPFRKKKFMKLLVRLLHRNALTLRSAASTEQRKRKRVSQSSARPKDARSGRAYNSVSLGAEDAGRGRARAANYCTVRYPRLTATPPHCPSYSTFNAANLANLARPPCAVAMEIALRADSAASCVAASRMRSPRPRPPRLTLPGNRPA